MTRVRLRDTTTGEERDVSFPVMEELFWTDGDFGCDCNRALVFAWAGGEHADVDDVTCGEGRFEIVAAPWMEATG